MGGEPDAQAVADIGVDAIGEKQAGVMAVSGIRPAQLGQSEKARGLQQRCGMHQIIINL